MASSTEICNLALSHLGVGKEIANLETERSPEAAACRRFYEITRDAVLREYHWPFAKRVAPLALVNSNPNDEWGYSYRYPTDCSKIRRILSGLRNDSRQSRIPYTIAQDDDGQLIFTDQVNAEIEYTKKETNPERYPPDFVLAFSLRIAAYIAPRVAGGDPFKMGTRAMNLYISQIGISDSTASNEEQAEEAPSSEFIRARE